MFQSILKSLFRKEKEEELKKKETERQARSVVNESIEIEKRLARKEQQIELHERELRSKDQRVEEKLRQADLTKKGYEERKEKILVKLEKIAQMTKDEARKLLLQAWEDRMKGD